MNCPKCNKLMDHQEEESDVGIQGCFFCETCDITIDDMDVNEYDPEL